MKLIIKIITKTPNNIHFGKELVELKNAFRDQVALHVAYILTKNTGAKWLTSTPLCDIHVYDPKIPSNLIVIQHLNTSPNRLTVRIHHCQNDENYRRHVFSVSANTTADKVAQDIFDNFVKYLEGVFLTDKCDVV